MTRLRHSFRQRCSPLVACTIALGCGPTTQIDDDTGTPSTSNTAGSSSAAETDSSADATLDDTASGDGLGVCGDGNQDEGEACDDGNTTNADGCSAQCQVSGTVTWSIPVQTDEVGFGIGIDAREGFGYFALQHYASGDGLDPAISLHRVNREGTVHDEYLDVGGFSDLDFARQPIASTTQGDFMAGYFISMGLQPAEETRVFGRINAASGLQWSYETSQRWITSYGTIWNQQGAFVLHDVRIDGQEASDFVIEWFDHDGSLVRTLPLGANSDELFPISNGGIINRASSRLAVISRDRTTEALALHTVQPSADSAAPPEWLVDPILDNPTPGPVDAFAAGAEIHVWTSDERVIIDVLDHPQPATPRTVQGQILVSWAGGFALSSDGERNITVYDDDGTMQWSLDTTLVPQYARVDGDEGLFVLTDSGAVGQGNQAELLYVVL